MRQQSVSLDSANIMKIVQLKMCYFNYEYDNENKMMAE